MQARPIQGRTMAKPFTIKLFMPSGNANELKLIEKMNLTGLGMEISSYFSLQNMSASFNILSFLTGASIPH
jgi:hypothetical protein